VIIHSKQFFDIHYSNRSIDDFPFFYSVQNDPSLFVHHNNMNKIEVLFQEILEEYNSVKDLKLEKIRSLTDILYIELSRLYDSKITYSKHQSGNYISQLKRLEDLIDASYLREKSAAYYADKMNISTKHLNRIVQNLVGKTTSDLITERIMLEAQRLLSGTNITIAELTDFLGYEDQSYFSRLFKKRLGVTPSEFSKKY